MKAQAQAAYQAPSRAIARELAKDPARETDQSLPTVVDCFDDDFEACMAQFRVPVNHHCAVRTTNFLERLFVEERQRVKINPNTWGQRSVLKLMFGAMIRVSERWKSIRVTEFERRQLQAFRRELNGEYETDNPPARGPI